MSRGLLVAFEGGEASGKSTQSAKLAEKLGAVYTREPGGTPFGERVRELFQHTHVRIDPRAEALLVASARAQHVVEVIEPALSRGRNVVTDRYVGSSLAYQGYGRGLDLEELSRLSQWAADGQMADVSILIDVSLETSRARRDQAFDGSDRFERERDEFHEKVTAGYRAIAKTDATRWLIIDGEGTVDEVFERVFTAFTEWEQHRG